MTETIRQPVLVLYADGGLELPTARTYGEALAICEAVAKLARLLGEQAMAQPLRSAPAPEGEVKP